VVDGLVTMRWEDRTYQDGGNIYNGCVARDRVRLRL
jgi:hypothetical protein